jgi:hypothetical protein
MILDFRLLNLVTLNEKTAQLPSIQSIEANFFNANVTTIDLSNCYPSIEIAKSSRNYFNFFCEDQVWHHARLAQGWSASLKIAQRAVLWTFRDEALQAFLKMKGLTQSDFPFLHFHEFASAFVDDIEIHSGKDLPNAIDVHLLCIEATFYALEKAGWLVKLEVSTFMNPKFVFLGLFWDLDQQSSMVQNDRVASILSHRYPRSLPELASRLATLQYYQSHLPLMKRISIPLYRIIKTGKFVWTIVEAHAYGNLLYLMGLQIKNTIFNPTRTSCYMCDTGALETALLIFQWDPEKLDLNLIHTKSILLPTSIRRQAAAHREAFGMKELIQTGKPYLFQSRSKVDYFFNDVSSISYISRNKPFSSFLQTLAEDLSLFPNLVTVHIPGRCLWFCDILTRQLDNVSVERTDTNISKEQAQLVPALKNIKPGAILTNKELLDMFATSFGPEVTDVSDSDYHYVQKINWSLYTNQNQFFLARENSSLAP